MGVTLACAAGLLGAAMFRSELGARQVHERLELGCLDVQDCRGLVHAAENAAESCWVKCDAHARLVTRARARFRSALEEDAHRERERQNSAYEHALAEQRAGETARSQELHRLRLEEMARHHQYELERLEAETRRLHEEKARAAANHLTYLRQLTREQRLRRLTACHESGSTCDQEVAFLVDSAASTKERKQLVDAHERYLTGVAEPVSSPLGTPAERDGNSAAVER